MIPRFRPLSLLLAFGFESSIGLGTNHDGEICLLAVFCLVHVGNDSQLLLAHQTRSLWNLLDGAHKQTTRVGPKTYGLSRPSQANTRTASKNC